MIYIMPKLQQTIFPERIQEYSRSIFLLREELDEWFQDFKIMEPEFVVCFSFEGRHWEGSRKFANGINQFELWY
jgi:hypothetical protein